MAQQVQDSKVRTLILQVRTFGLSGKWLSLCRTRRFEPSSRGFEPLGFLETSLTSAGLKGSNSLPESSNLWVVWKMAMQVQASKVRTLLLRVRTFGLSGKWLSK
ncbi:hypothetical protein AAC387_Pa07g3119 [Persea americana]